MNKRYPARRWTVGLIHHAHTDIGYTDLQPIIRRRHVRYLDEALQLVRRRREGDPSLRGFVWSNECFWSLEQWLRSADAARQAEMAAAIRDGHIGLSGTYLHYTELVDARTLERKLAAGAAYARAIGVPLDTAVSADVNGFGWGYAQKLHDAGIRHLLVCLHSHHGMAPLGRRQTAFRWETPRGGEIFVWLNEHYLLGNVLGLAPGALLNYAFADELQPRPAAAENLPIAETRLLRYLRGLEADGYAADFVPIHVAGMTTDNAPPSAAIARFAGEWNARHGHHVRLEMMTPSTVAARLRQSFPEPPRYRGDWPDWWSDGVAATPADTRLCRHAQRGLRYLELLEGHLAAKADPAIVAQAEDAISLYSEHTFNHSAAMLAPWSIPCQAVGAGKSMQAARAFHFVGEALDEMLGRGVGGGPAAGAPLRYRAINPLPDAVRDVARLAVDFSEIDSHDVQLIVRDVASGRVLTHQQADSLRGIEVEVRLDLPARSETQLEILPGEPTLSHVGRQSCDAPMVALLGGDVAAAEDAPALSASDHVLESAQVRIVFEPDAGIVSWFDKIAGRELLRADREHAPFTPCYDVTPVAPRNDMQPSMGRNANVAVRSRMGRNRKGADARYEVGRLNEARALSLGALSASVRLDFACPGCEFYRVTLTAWSDLPRVDVTVRLLKQATWEPENLYLALPFTSGADEEEFWIEKAGALVRPWRDQLPDTLTDFYCVEDGVAWLSAGRGAVLTTPDAPLIQLGPLRHERRRLMDDRRRGDTPTRVYSWLMTNYWETNFAATAAGFHEFAFRLEWGPQIATPDRAQRLCRALNHGIGAHRRAVRGADAP